MGKINIFGKVNKALHEAMDSGGQNFTFSNIDEKEAFAIKDLLLSGFMHLLRDLIKKARTSGLEASDEAFSIDLTTAIRNQSTYSSGRLYSYHPDTQELIVTLPVERVEAMIEKIAVMRESFDIIASSQKCRVDLPNHGQPICYRFGSVDTTETIGNEKLTMNTYHCIDSIMRAHGFNDVVAVDLKQLPNLLAVKATALDTVLRLEQLDYPTLSGGMDERGH